MKTMIMNVALFLLAFLGTGGLALANSSDGSVGNTAASAPSRVTKLPATLRPALYQALVKDAGPAYPITVDPLVWVAQRVTASDGRAGDQLGYSVALSGKTALVGAWHDGNEHQGAVYVFTKSNNGTWTQTQKLTANNGDQYFGTGLALDGSTAFIEAYHYNPNGDQRGVVYVFTKSGGVWQQTQKLTESDGSEQNAFGYSLALDDSTVLIGDPSSPDFSWQGAVYVFTKSNNGTWTQTQKLTASDGEANFFGGEVALDGSTALIGAPTGLGGVPDDEPGAAYVFVKSENGTWEETEKLSANDGTVDDWFGYSVTLKGTTALIGAYGATVDGNVYGGAAYVFVESDGSWAETQKLIPNDEAPNANFGFSVALSDSGKEVAVGTAKSGTYLYKKSGGIWEQQQNLLGYGINDGFGGWSLDFDNDTLISGCPACLVGLNFNQGAVFIYAKGNLGIAMTAPTSVATGQDYVDTTIVTNYADRQSPVIELWVTIPPWTQYQSVATTQGDCDADVIDGLVICQLGSIADNAGTAMISTTLKAIGDVGDTIENNAILIRATPALTASAPTLITESCPAGYTEFDGHLDAGGTFTSSPIEVEEAGQKYVDLTAPASFAFFAIVNTRYGQHTYVYPHAKHGHRWGAAGTYRVGVQAGPDTGGDYTLCVQLNPPD